VLSDTSLRAQRLQGSLIWKKPKDIMMGFADLRNNSDQKGSIFTTISTMFTVDKKSKDHLLCIGFIIGFFKNTVDSSLFNR